uniref:Uncharacterized protein n=1 Tax=Arundo donax TaxID=35708 RepID=A0A0A9FQ46_ARUDO
MHSVQHSMSFLLAAKFNAPTNTTIFIFPPKKITHAHTHPQIMYRSISSSTLPHGGVNFKKKQETGQAKLMDSKNDELTGGD